jgi:putative addiction module component (TIGR02574 family)
MITTSELNKLSIQDKIILLEQLWSSLKQEGDNLQSPKWHGDVLAERRRKIENGEAEYLSLDDLKSRRK